ncbi:MAG TPA: hypothetical protein VFJ19_16035 [Nocardioidaceae bacterium]|nr:hypothetical protein [Nocardioidaceae bacterium]
MPEHEDVMPTCNLTGHAVAVCPHCACRAALAGAKTETEDA